MSEALASMRIDLMLPVTALAAAAVEARKHIDNIGNSGIGAGDKLDRATARMAARIKEVTIAAEAGGRGTARYFEAWSKANGQEKALDPLIKKLREVEAAQARATSAVAANDGVWGNTTQSAKQMSFALRQVPMQFTDIWVSLASGQRPLQVFMQQGGQLKDMFGSVGGAASALGRYVLGLINPVTIAIGVLGALAFAWKQGDDEQREFQKHAVLTGNTMALSAIQYTQARDAIAGIGATRGKASEVLTEIAKNGQISAASMQLVGETAVLMQKAADVSIADTVKAFAKLREDPVKASEELNKQYRFLTVAVYEQIKALDEQGRKVEAANVAERSYADEMKRRAATVVENIGFMERAWRGLAGAAKGAWDAMLNVGRKDTQADELDKLRSMLSKWESDLASTGGAGKAGVQAGIDKIKLQISLIQENVRMEQRLSERMAERQRIEQAGIAAVAAATATNEKARSKQEQMNDALADYRRQIEAIRAANPSSALLDPAKIAKAEAAIRAQFTKSDIKAANRELEERRKLLFELSGVNGDYIEQLQRLQKLQAGGNVTEQKYIELVTELINKQPGVKKINDEIERRFKLLAAEAKLIQEWDDDWSKALADESKARERARLAVDAYAAGIDNATEQLQLEKSTLGQSEEIRKRTLAIYRIELELKRQIAAIDATDGFDEAQREEQRAKAREAAARARANAALTAEIEVADKAFKKWEKTNEKIADSFVDNLMRGGKSVAEYLKDLFRTLVLRPILQPIGNAFAGAVNGMVGGAMNSMGFNMAGNIGGSMAGAMGLPTMAGAGGGLSAFLFGTGGGGSAIATSAGALEAGVMVEGVGGTAGLLGGVEAAMAAIPGWGWAILAAAAVAALWDKGGGPKADGRFGFTVSDIGAGGTTSQLNSAAMQAVTGLQTQFDMLMKLVGATSAIKFGAGISTDPEGDSPTFIDFTASRDGQAVFHQLNRNVGRSQEELTAAMTQMGAQALIGALQSVMWEMPPVVRREVEGLDLSALTAETAQGIVATIQKALTEKSALEDRLFALTATDAEMLAKVRERERAAIDASNHALLDQIYAQEDLKLAAEAMAEEAAKARAIADERAGLERELLELQGDAAALLKLQRDALDESNRALFDQIIALRAQQEAEAEAAAAAQRAAEEAAAKAEAVASQRAALERELLQLQGDTVALRALERAEVDESNLALFDHIQSLKDEAEAAAKAAEAVEAAKSRFAQLQSVVGAFLNPQQLQQFQAQAIADQFNAATGYSVSADQVLGASLEGFAALFMEVNAAGNTGMAGALLDVASAFVSLRESIDGPMAALVQQRASMEAELARLNGDLAPARALELAAMDESLRPLQETIWAREKELAVLQEREGLQMQLWRLLGDEQSIREAILATLDPSNHELQKRIWLLEDEIAIEQKRKAAAEATKRAWEQLTDTMMDEVRRLRGLIFGGTPSQSLAFLQTQFSIASAAARAGDQGAAGRLPGLSQAIEQAAMQSVRTLPELNTIRGGLADTLESIAVSRGYTDGSAAVVEEVRELRREAREDRVARKVHEDRIEVLERRVVTVLEGSYDASTGRLLVTTT